MFFVYLISKISILSCIIAVDTLNLIYCASIQQKTFRVPISFARFVHLLRLIKPLGYLQRMNVWLGGYTKPRSDQPIIKIIVQLSPLGELNLSIHFCFGFYWYLMRLKLIALHQDLATTSTVLFDYRAPQGGLEIPLSCKFFAQITSRNCLKFMFTPSLPNHAGCQIDHSRNYAIFFHPISVFTL